MPWPSLLSSVVVYVIWPHGSVAVGRRRARFVPAGLKSAGLMRLPTNPPPRLTCRPLLHAGEANAGKPPQSIQAVGTREIGWEAGSAALCPDSRRRRTACLA